MSANEKKGIPEGIWSKCAVCNEIIYQKEFLKNYKVCPKCNFHYQLSAYERIDSLLDNRTFVETDRGLTSTNPLNFTANKPYDESLAQSIEKTSLPEAVVTGEGRLNGRKVALAVMDFRFIGGSMGSVVGEKVTRAIERAADKKIPLIIVAASGGARMQEGMFSLMQMAKTSAAVNKLSQQKVLYVSILTHPTTGGVTASFATLADVIIAEPGALIGFTGPRVIEQTIKQKLPEGFQTAEFLLEHGMVDMVVERPKIRGEVAKLFNLLMPERKISTAVRNLSTEGSKDASPKEVFEAMGDALKEEIGKRVQKIQNKLKKGQ